MPLRLLSTRPRFWIPRRRQPNRLGATPGAPPNTTGYAVFGHVVQGMDIVDAIAGVELAPPAEKHPFPGKLPLTPVVIKKATVIKE
jgi:cyclophilin family peptidyl-prolyl cis-trans isomerase